MELEKEPIEAVETEVKTEVAVKEAEVVEAVTPTYEGLLNVLDTCNLIFAFLFAILGVVSFILVSRDNFELIGKSLQGSFYTDMRFGLGYLLPFAISSVALIPSSVLAAIGLNHKRNAILNTVTIALIAVFFLFAAVFFLLFAAKQI